MSVYVVVRGELSLLEPDIQIQGIFRCFDDANKYIEKIISKEGYWKRKNKNEWNKEYDFLKIDEYIVK